MASTVRLMCLYQHVSKFPKSTYGQFPLKAFCKVFHDEKTALRTRTTPNTDTIRTIC